MGAFTDPTFNTSMTFPIETEVDALNPNYVGAQIGVGHLVVTSGGFVLAEVETMPAVIRAHGHSEVRAVSSSTITPEVSKYLMSVLPPTFALEPEVTGDIPAKVFGFLNVKVKLHCTVDVEVLSILKEPVKMIRGQHCAQWVSL